MSVFLRNQDIRNVSLSYPDFSEADLNGCVFIDCKLTNANFSNSNFVGAIFIDTTMDGANLENTGIKIADPIEPEPENLLTENWRTPGTGNKIEDLSDGGFTYTVLEPNKNQQVYQNGLSIVEGIRYRLSFICRYGSGVVKLHDHSQGYDLGLSSPFVDNSASTFTFVAPATSTNGRLRFMCINNTEIIGCYLRIL